MRDMRTPSYRAVAWVEWKQLNSMFGLFLKQELPETDSCMFTTPYSAWLMVVWVQSMANLSLQA